MGFVKYQQQGLVGIITIDRENALNALNSEVIQNLDEILDQITLDTTRCVMITGAGSKSFVAGADIGEMVSKSKSDARAFTEMGHRVFRKIETLPIPVIAAVNGYAFGGGCELALACDIRIASENAIFAQPEVTLGIIPGFGGTQRLPRLIGVGKAKEIMYTNNRIKADEAARIGLVNAVYPVETFWDECIKCAEKICQNAPIAVRSVKKAVNEGMQVDIEEGLNIEIGLSEHCFDTYDQKNAMQAFLEKRKPEPFINR